MMSVTDAENGVDIVFSESVRNVREGYISAVKTDGLSITLDDLEILSETAKPTLFIGKESDVYGNSYDRASGKNVPLALVFDTAEGALDAYPGGERVIKSDFLKTDKLSGRLKLSLYKTEKGYTVGLKTDFAELAGEITEAVLSQATGLLEKSIVMLSSWDSGSSYSVTFEGLHELNCGDANADGSFDIRDLVRLKNAAAGTENADMENLGLDYTDEITSETVAAVRRALAENREFKIAPPEVPSNTDITDNSSLLPQILPDDAVTVDSNGTPDWVSGLILGEMRIKTATPEGTLDSAVRVLDHYAEMGINGVWITPVYDPGVSGNGYTNLGLNTVDPAITGETDYALGWERVGEFVKEAHKRNIRVILDVISWGTTAESPIIKEHPEWYSENASAWGPAFDWSNSELREWFIKNLVNISEVTGCDGFRLDVEPNTSGYTVYGELRSRLLSRGRKLFMMSEWYNDRKGVYDCEQIGVTGITQDYNSEKPVYRFLDKYDIVSSIKNGVNIGGSTAQNPGGNYRYYVNTLSCHDNKYTVINGNRIAIGYQAIFSPFIPMWYLGEEWNNSRDSDLNSKGSVLYFNSIHWEQLENTENREFFEAVKRMIRVRRKYTEIYTAYPEKFKDTAITAISGVGINAVSYARYSGNSAIIVIPNYSNVRSEVNLSLPISETGLSGYRYFTVTDGETGELLTVARGVEALKIAVEAMSQRIIRICAE